MTASTPPEVFVPGRRWEEQQRPDRPDTPSPVDTAVAAVTVGCCAPGPLCGRHQDYANGLHHGYQLAVQFPQEWAAPNVSIEKRTA